MTTQAQIENLYRLLRTSYLNTSQVNALITAKVGELQSLANDVAWLSQQYNTVIGTSVKFLSTAEYNTLAETRVVAVNIMNDVQQLKQEVIADIATVDETIENTFTQYRNQLSIAITDIENLKTQINDIAAQVGALNAIVLEIQRNL